MSKIMYFVTFLRIIGILFCFSFFAACTKNAGVIFMEDGQVFDIKPERLSYSVRKKWNLIFGNVYFLKNNTILDTLHSKYVINYKNKRNDKIIPLNTDNSAKIGMFKVDDYYVFHITGMNSSNKRIVEEIVIDKYDIDHKSFVVSTKVNIIPKVGKENKDFYVGLLSDNIENSSFIIVDKYKVINNVSLKKIPWNELEYFQSKIIAQEHEKIKDSSQKDKTVEMYAVDDVLPSDEIDDSVKNKPVNINIGTKSK